MRYAIRFSYLGTSFHGSQTQPNGITVQQVMEQAFATILRTSIPLTFAGRTDAGVHAKEMVAHFDVNEQLPQNFTSRLNSLLPDSIAIADIYSVPDTFHARFDATSRCYTYIVTTRKNPFLYGLSTRVPEGLDYNAMNQAAQCLLGRHNFASFCKVHTDVKTTFCTITKALWTQDEDPSVWVFTIQADRFLRNMVRAIVGTLLEVGRHQLSTAQFEEIIHAHNRRAAGQSAPAEGLYLIKVNY